MSFQVKMRIHNHDYLSPCRVCNSTVCSAPFGKKTVSSHSEFHISFYAWRIYKCMNLPEYGLLYFLRLWLSLNSQHGPTIHPKLHRNTAFLLENRPVI